MTTPIPDPDAPIRSLRRVAALFALVLLAFTASPARAQASGVGEGLREAKEAVVEAARKTGEVAKQAASATAKVAVSVGKGAASAASGAYVHTKKVSKQVAGEVAGKAREGASAVKGAASQ